MRLLVNLNNNQMTILLLRTKYSARWVLRPVFLDTIEVAKPKVLFIYWLSRKPEFLVAKPKMVAKPKVAVF